MLLHSSVLLKESIDMLRINPNGTYVDATFGNGGHSLAILSVLQKGRLIAMDQDKSVNLRAQEISKQWSNFTFINANFQDLQQALTKLEISGIDGIIYDLGVSSMQFDQAERGFSYRFDGELDMRMNQDNFINAKQVVNQAPLEKLLWIFNEYGQSNLSYQVAKKIINSRPINTTLELVNVIKSALPQQILKKPGHPAKVFFQALRIYVNNELEVLKNSLKSALELIKLKGRICVITFQSLEDRIVKKLFVESTAAPYIPKEVPIQVINNSEFKIITKKPIEPSPEEIISNPRSKSAKLRVIERIRGNHV